MSDYKDYYAILRIPPDATPKEIKSAYHEYVKFYHPDKWRDTSMYESAEKHTKEINEAYKVLSNPELRSKFDIIYRRRNRYTSSSTGPQQVGTDYSDPTPRSHTESAPYKDTAPNTKKTPPPASTLEQAEKHRKSVVVLFSIITVSVLILLISLFYSSRTKQASPRALADSSSTPTRSVETPTPTVTIQFLATDSIGSNTVVPQATSIAPVEHNSDWTTTTQEFNGVLMALVPPGCFDMGSENGEVDEVPINRQCFAKPFWIDVYEVTNKQYGGPGIWPEDNQPRGNTDWVEALAYCRSREARLPTEAEWEYAARGPDNLIYPWGNTFVSTNVVYADNSDGEPAQVGTKPQGASWIGALDLAGNVHEWVSSLYTANYPYNASDGRENSTDRENGRVLRGGSFDVPNEPWLRATDRYWHYPWDDRPSIGFRCARDY